MTSDQERRELLRETERRIKKVEVMISEPHTYCGLLLALVTGTAVTVALMVALWCGARPLFWAVIALGGVYGVSYLFLRFYLPRYRKTLLAQRTMLE